MRIESEHGRTAVRRLIQDYTMPLALATSVRRYLKDTPEYDLARHEGRARAWLDSEAQSLGYALAEVVQQRLENLEP